MITEGQIINMCDELEKLVQSRDPSYNVRIQSANGALGTTYLVHIESFFSPYAERYVVDAQTHEWIREYL